MAEEKEKHDEMENQIADEKSNKENFAPNNKEIIASILAYFWILFFIPMILCPESKFGRYHANQGFLLLLFGIVTAIISGILGIFTFVPVIGIILSIIGSILGIINLGYLIYGIYNVICKKCKPLPFIGKYDLIK